MNSEMLYRLRKLTPFVNEHVIVAGELLILMQWLLHVIGSKSVNTYAEQYLVYELTAGLCCSLKIVGLDCALACISHDAHGTFQSQATPLKLSL